VIHPA